MGSSGDWAGRGITWRRSEEGWKWWKWLLGENSAILRQFVRDNVRYNAFSYAISIREDAGFSRGAEVNAAPPAFRPMAFYGTSITRGGCANSAGTDFVSAIGRPLDREVIDLGFSGKGNEIECVAVTGMDGESPDKGFYSMPPSVVMRPRGGVGIFCRWARPRLQAKAYPLRPWKNRGPVPPAGDCPLGKISLLGMMRQNRGLGSMRVYGKWAFVYVVEGQGYYEDGNGLSREVESGDWILVFPELAHRYGPYPGQRWNEFYICFHGPLFEGWRQAGIFDAARPVGSLKPVSLWWKEMAAMVKRMESRGTSALEAVTLWQAMLGKIMAGRKPARNAAHERIERACHLLERKSEKDDAGGRRTAEELGMGYDNFRKQFVRHMGVPPGRYREQLRAERAKQLLRAKRLTNKELAEMLGFCDEAHFSKAFTRLAGVSPRAFRKSI